MSSPRSAHPAPAYQSRNSRAHPYDNARYRRMRSPAAPEELLPPSPRSYRDGGSPPVAKPAAVDPNDNYWDDVPAPPASLKSILDSFRASGEGDRDLLLAILGAKKAEEDRLTAIIQTRLTVLQARLNLASIQAQLAAPPAMGMPSPADFPERTPSLSHSSASSAINSPPLPPMHMHPHQYYHHQERVLPPPSHMGYDRLPPIHRDRSDSTDSRRPEGLEMLLEGVREAERKERA